MGAIRESARGGGRLAAEVAGEAGRRPQSARNWGGTGEVKQGVGEPNSQMGKSYANSALRRANQCSPCALPRDGLALEEGGVEPPGIPALPIQVYARSLAACSYTPARASRCSPFSLFHGPTPRGVRVGDSQASSVPDSRISPPAPLPESLSPKLGGDQGSWKVLEERSRKQHSPSVPKPK